MKMKPKNRFKKTEIGMIPDDWSVSSLADHIELIGGGTPKTTVDAYWNGDIPWISVADFVGDNRWIHNTEKHITNKGLENSSTKLLHKGQIIISARGTVGALGQVTKDMAFNQSCYGIDGKGDLNNDYLYYLLKQKVREFQQKGHGAVFNTITKETFNQIVIPIPEVSEQRSITKILSDLDSKIELNRQMNSALEQVGQALFKRWFVDFEFPDEGGKPYKSSGGKMVDSELGMIPKEYKVGTLGALMEITSGKRPDGVSEQKTAKFGVPLIGASSVMGFVERSLYTIPILIIGRVGTHGIVQRILPPSFPSDNTLVIKSKFYEYSYQVLKKIDYHSLNVGSTQPLITQSSINKYVVVIPDDATSIRFEQILSILFFKVHGNMLEIETLSQIRDTLLPKLMSGEIRVSANA